MPGSSVYINQIDLDPNFFVWATGQDLRKFNGTSWEYYDSSNSAVPSNSPYYLDTRSISIDNSGIAWCGSAQISNGLPPSPPTEDVDFYNQRTSGFNFTINSTGIQSDGKIVMAGGFTLFNGNSRNHIVRLNPDGSEDSSFYNNLGATGFNFYNTLDGLRIQTDGKILVGSSFTSLNGNSRNRLVRLNSNGSEDTSFYSNLGTGFLGGSVLSVFVQTDGKIVIGGDFTSLNGNPRNRLVRLNSDGTEDTSFYTNLTSSGTGLGLNGQVSCIRQQSDGKLLVTGDFTTLNSLTRQRLIRLNPDGTEDSSFYSVLTSFGSGFNFQPEGISIQSDGKIIITGPFSSFNGSIRYNIVRLNANGAEDLQFYSNVTSTGDGTGFQNGGAYHTRIQSDGKIIVTGGFTDFNDSGNNNRNRIVRLNSDGTEDSDFYTYLNPGFDSDVYSCEIQDNEKILLGGSFTTFGGNSRNYSIRLNPSVESSGTPIIFNLDTSEVTVGESWLFSDISNNFDPILYEASLIYASPYGSEVLSFITPKNGIGGTGATAYTRIKGVTGGRLFFYDKNIEEWNETLPGYTWPHIFQIKAKGYKGEYYRYFLGTSQGLWVIPPGKLSTFDLNEDGEIVKQAIVYNTSTSGIISNNVYSLDFDENGNLWVGTDLGISFFDGTRFWNYGTTGPVTYVKSRENGHVFYSRGDGELSQGTGLWHFNGTTHTNVNSSNSDLSNNNVLGISLIENGTKQGNLTLYENSLWILCLNDISSFVYDLPHVYASSKTQGPTGWNFTYHVPSGGTGETGSAPLAKINKYTWTYPEWQIYDSEFISEKLPGLDPRNLFLTVPIKDIANGKAGEQYYWSNSPIPSYDQQVLEEKVGEILWDSQITMGSTGDVKITCSASIQTELGPRYFIGGYMSGDIGVSFGYYNDSTPAYLQNLNPTIGASGSTGGNSLESGEMGFIVSYDYDGAVDSILPFRGYKTRIDSIDSSPDDYTISVSGTYNWFIESGPWVWHSWEGANAFSGIGVTGAPYGATNINYPGLTSGVYDWIYDPLNSISSILGGASWDYNPGAGSSISNGQIDISFSGITTNYSEINGFWISYLDDGLVDRTSLLQSIVTSNVIVDPNVPQSYYSVNSVLHFPGGIFFGVSFQSGFTGAIPYSPSSTINLDFYDWYNGSYPLVKNLNSFPGDLSSSSYGVFCAEIQRDLGNKSSFTGITGDYNYGVSTSYRISRFRNFPVKNLNFLSGNNVVPKTSIQRTNYHTHLLVESNVSGNLADLSTLKNEWERTTDNNSVDNYLSDPGYTGLLSYVKLNNLDYSLQENYNSSTPGSTGGWLRIGSEINCIDLGESAVITGSATGGFSFSGNTLTPIASTGYSPFYISITTNPVGSTGFYLTSFGNTGNKIGVTKDNSNYYITTVVGSSGTYFTKPFVAESDKTYFLTAKLTEQTICDTIFYPSLTGSNASLDLKNTLKLPNGQLAIHYENEDAPLTYVTKILKTDESSRINDTITIGDFFGDAAVSTDHDSNIFISGFNSLGLTSNAYVNFGYFDEGYVINLGSGFTYLIKKYQTNLGIDEGKIISRPGSNPWVWSDCHLKGGRSFQIPLMSTVIFNNYTSEIYGKNNNEWILSNASTGQEILNIKNSPYFIYTFTQEGEYSVYNEVSDSQGNVYSSTGNGFVTVIDHKKQRIPGKSGTKVDSSNYGVNRPFSGRDYEEQKLAKDLAKDQKDIFESGQDKIGPIITIPENPDSAFKK